LLAACGGGGGDGGGGTPPPTAEPLQITSANYQTVAQEAASSTYYLLDSSQFVTGAQVDTRPALAALAWRQFVKLPRQLAAPGWVTGATMTETMQCSGGGQIQATINDTNGNQDIDAGESATLVATGCVESGVTINGTLGFTVNTLSGDLYGDVYAASIGVTLGSFSVASGGGNESASGTMAIDIAATGPNASTLKVSVGSLSMKGDFGGITDTVSMQNYVIQQTLTPMGNGSKSSTSVSGVFASSAFEARSVTLSTVSPFVALPDDAYPSSGQMLATGLAGSKVSLTALNATTVLLELDANGDGTYESSVSRAWSSLF
jgi:hypothetical protein